MYFLSLPLKSYLIMEIWFTSNLNHFQKFVSKYIDRKRQRSDKEREKTRMPSFFICASENHIWITKYLVHLLERTNERIRTTHNTIDPYQTDSSNIIYLSLPEVSVNINGRLTGRYLEMLYVSIKFAFSKLICPFSKMKMSVMTIRCEFSIQMCACVSLWISHTNREFSHTHSNTVRMGFFFRWQRNSIEFCHPTLTDKIISISFSIFWMREYYNKYSALWHKIENYYTMNEAIGGIQLLRTNEQTHPVSPMGQKHRRWQ